MASCNFCKITPKESLKSCVCGKVSYCSKDCQVKDWKAHKQSCPPYVIRESPGKGRGLFATRKIKAGQVILEEYPLMTVSGGGMSVGEFRDKYYPNLSEEIKAEILQLNDPAEDIKTLDTDTVEKLARKNPVLMFYKKADTDEIRKIFRIFYGNSYQICEVADLYDTTEGGLYNKISLINHSCIPNATLSWVMGDFKRKQVRAFRIIEKDEEIVASYLKSDFIYVSRESRRQELLETYGFPCQCSECSREGEDLEENERMRAEIREKGEEGNQLVGRLGSEPVPRKSVKKAMKLSQQRTKLIQKLSIWAGVVSAMIEFYRAAKVARRMGIPCENDPETFKQEALKYAKLFGDDYLQFYF